MAWFRVKPPTGTRPSCGASCDIERLKSGSTSRVTRSGRTPTTTLAATPSSGAPCSIGLRREDFDVIEHEDGISPALADRLRHAGAVLRQGRGHVRRARRGGRGSDGTAAWAISTCRDSARTEHGRSRRPAASDGSAPVAAAARIAAARRSRRMHPLPDVQLLSVPNRCEERRRVVRHRARHHATERHLAHGRDGAPADHRSLRSPCAGGRGRPAGHALTASRHRS